MIRTFRISYRVHDYNGAVVVDASDVNDAEKMVRRQYAPTSIRNITVRCDCVTQKGERCGRFSVENQCPAHRPR